MNDYSTTLETQLNTMRTQISSSLEKARDQRNIYATEFIAAQPTTMRYSLAYEIVPVGKTSIPHSPKTSEVYYIISGVGEMSIDSEVRRIEPGDAVYIPPNAITGQTTTTADESAIRTFHHHRIASWTHRIQRTGTLGVMCRIDAQLVRI